MKECRFCQIIEGNREKEEVVYENQDFIVLTDKFRKTSVGGICLIIPKGHKKNILELTENDGKSLILTLNLVSKAMQRAYNVNGIRIWTAVNKEAGQSIFHCHLHVVACKNLKDRLIANFAGLYDLKRRILCKNGLSESQNFEFAEKIRMELSRTEKPTHNNV